MPLKEEVRILHSSDILAPLSEEELEDLARRHPDFRLREGEILFGPEDVGERLYIVKEGRIRLYKVGSDGQEITIAFVDEGRTFGEMAFSAQRTRKSYAQAAQPTLLISLERDDVYELIREKPEVGIRLIERLSERVEALENRLEDVTLKDMPARLATLILQLLESEGVKTDEGYYKIPRRYSHEQLASMLNAHRVSVTRAYATLKGSGIVELRDHLLHIKDLEALGRAAQEERRAKRIGGQVG
jgi:CRP/FNR family transcriptional regulator, cyclic AMP receptor protein